MLNALGIFIRLACRSDFTNRTSMMSTYYSDAEIRKILLEHRYFYTIDELCRKWSLTKYQLRIWKRAFQYTCFIGEVRDLAVVALHSGANEICNTRDFPDYLNHCFYSQTEIVEGLAQLSAQGLAIPVNGVWLYDKSYS
jgi:hypothetical protein